MSYCTKIYLDMIIKFIVIIGAINWGMVGIFQINIVSGLSQILNTNVNYIVYTIIGLCGLGLLFDRNTYLPFLDNTAFPIPLENKIPKKNGDLYSVELKHLPPHRKIIYWASNPSSSTYKNPIDAYGKFENQGVATSDSHGKATIVLNKPTSYKVDGKTLKPHVHYRYWSKEGIASEVKTVKIC